MEDSLKTHLQYASGWRLNAEFFQQQQCYEWMVDQLAEYRPKKVLDIGCGAGHGLLALSAKLAPRIIALDENPQCLGLTRHRLAEAGFDSEIIAGLRYQCEADDTHTIQPHHGLIRMMKNISLIHADILIDDENLFSVLLKEMPFDAVTLWLIGTENSRLKSCRNLNGLDIKDPADYRISAHRRAYLLADQLLKKGGVLQIVDRAGVSAEEAREQGDWLDMHRELAVGTSLKPRQSCFRDYREPPKAGINMVSTRSPSTRLNGSSALSMVSIISVFEGE